VFKNPENKMFKILLQRVITAYALSEFLSVRWTTDDLFNEMRKFNELFAWLVIE